MGFLSRKSKNRPAPVEETHPIEDELEEIERVLPETPPPAERVPEPTAAAAGPAAKPSPAGPGREAEDVPVDGEALRKADDDRRSTHSEEALRPAEAIKVKERPEVEEPERFNARDLIAPSRH
jgi:hypothetical protein